MMPANRAEGRQGVLKSTGGPGTPPSTSNPDAREKAGSARFAGTSDPASMAGIVIRVMSVIDPAGD